MRHIKRNVFWEILFVALLQSLMTKLLPLSFLSKARAMELLTELSVKARLRQKKVSHLEFLFQFVCTVYKTFEVILADY